MRILQLCLLVLCAPAVARASSLSEEDLARVRAVVAEVVEQRLDVLERRVAELEYRERYQVQHPVQQPCYGAPSPWQPWNPWGPWQAFPTVAIHPGSGASTLPYNERNDHLYLSMSQANRLNFEDARRGWGRNNRRIVGPNQREERFLARRLR